jgi:structural maintenance of chromosome 1
MVKQNYKKEELKLKISSLKERLQLLSDTKSESNIGKKELQEAMKTKEFELNKVYEKLEILKAELKRLNNEFKGVCEERSKIQNHISKNKVALSRIEEELNDLINYASVDVNDDSLIENIKNVTVEVNKHLKFKEMELKDLKTELENINTRLSSTAPILNSFADESIQNKYKSINTEYELAKSKVLSVKKRFMDVKNMRMECFSECFVKISKEIPLIYKALNYPDDFDSDMNNLAYLAYEGDVFSNNLKYYLMPPMKRFTDFSELSGGEKSLALLCFIFALSKYKNPPFYIFDEVDSALDKVNVERLGNFIKNSSDQFLIISLKHQFYKNSESLVGVYKCPFDMKSKILTYKLN